jgi:ABC-type microcin C transport system duplicated ATPase subunit YejF
VIRSPLMTDRPSHPERANERPLLDVRDLRVWFPARRNGFRRSTERVRAVDSVSFTLEAGESLGLVGESGCGKTTLGRAILRLVPATGGEVRLRGRSVFGAAPREMRRLRRRMQIVFQDPIGSLNPRMRIGAIVGEPLLVHGIVHGAALRRRVGYLLEQCGLPPDAATRYPHQFSGGQRQRIAIARAIALRPDLIICDEPTSALDVSVQARILYLLAELQRSNRLSYLFISHDIAVVRQMCSRIAVMCRGRVVELGPTERVIHAPAHPCTQRLLASVPSPDPRAAHRPDEQQNRTDRAPRRPSAIAD